MCWQMPARLLVLADSWPQGLSSWPLCRIPALKLACGPQPLFQASAAFLEALQSSICCELTTAIGTAPCWCRWCSVCFFQSLEKHARWLGARTFSRKKKQDAGPIELWRAPAPETNFDAGQRQTTSDGHEPGPTKTVGAGIGRARNHHEEVQQSLGHTPSRKPEHPAPERQKTTTYFQYGAAECGWTAAGLQRALPVLRTPVGSVAVVSLVASGSLRRRGRLWDFCIPRSDA